MTAADAPTEKLRLRHTMQLRLREVTPEEARVAGCAIADRLEQSRVWQQVTRVGLFASRTDEVDTNALVERALLAGKHILFPRMTNVADLEFAAVTDVSQLCAGRWGIREPAPDSPVARPDRDTLLLVPGVAFDRDGGRLGRGRGYYDRALASLREGERGPIVIGVGFSFQLVERVPMTPLDVRLDGVVSQDELVEVESSGPRGARAARGTGRSGRDD